LMIVTDDGADGSSRHQATLILPTIFDRVSCPLSRILKHFRVYLADWVFDRRLKRGNPTRAPARLPLTESKKFLYARSQSRSDSWSVTFATSASQARSGVFFAAVSSFLLKSKYVGYFSPSA